MKAQVLVLGSAIAALALTPGAVLGTSSRAQVAGATHKSGPVVGQGSSIVAQGSAEAATEDPATATVHVIAKQVESNVGMVWFAVCTTDFEKELVPTIRGCTPSSAPSR